MHTCMSVYMCNHLTDQALVAVAWCLVHVCGCCSWTE